MVVLEPLAANRERRLLAVGTQAHVDVEQFAFAGLHRQGGQQTLAEPGEINTGGERFGAVRHRLERRVIDKNQIQVGGEGEFAAAQLAKG